MSNSKNKTCNPAFVIMKRELGSYFSSPIAYIVTGLFLIITGIMFFTAFFLQNQANMRNLFSILPLLLSLFIPALTMRLYSEEMKTGSIETLMTLPITETQVAAGKFLAALIASLAMIAPTLLYLVSILPFGIPDMGPVACGYLGTIFLCASFCAIGLFASSATKNQIVAFFYAFIICIALTMVSQFLIFLPSPIVSFLQFLSAEEHFTSISRGIIDSRDLLYFVSLTVLFFSLTVIAQRKKAK